MTPEQLAELRRGDPVVVTVREGERVGRVAWHDRSLCATVVCYVPGEQRGKGGGAATRQTHRVGAGKVHRPNDDDLRRLVQLERSHFKGFGPLTVERVLPSPPDALQGHPLFQPVDR